MARRTECIVYCRPWCGDCRLALRWLDDMGYAYTPIDIDENAEARKRCVELAGKVITPTFEIGETSVVGFDLHAVRDALESPPGTT